MNLKIAEKLLKLTEQGYRNISVPFSQTRQHAWRDFNLFKPFVKDGSTVLDVGCGSGRVFEFFKDSNIRYVGVDTNTLFIDEAAKRYAGHSAQPRFVTGDMLHLNNVLRGTQFDCVLSVAALHHIPSAELRKQVVQQMYDALKPGGTVIVTNWNFWRPTLKEKSFWKYTLQRVRMSSKEWRERFGFGKFSIGAKDLLTIWKSGQTETPLYYYTFTAHELKKLLSHAGFHVQDNFYTLNGARAHWWSGRNIITIAKKLN